MSHPGVLEAAVVGARMTAGVGRGRVRGETRRA